MTKNKMIISVLIITIMAFISACVSEKSTPITEIPPKQNDLQSKNPSLLTLDNVIAKAKNGQVLESPFNIVESTLNQVKDEWGEPDQVDQAGYGHYASYNKMNVVFGYNEAGEIFDVRSYAKNLHDITSEMVEKTIGKPDQVKEINNQNIYVYELDPFIELKFIFQKTTQRVDHISVFNPDRAKVEGTDSKLEYILEIKGRSNQLTARAWESMQIWRKQIVQFSKEQENVYINGPNKRKVALTFDDGPDATVTPAIIDILDKYHVRGNFFFIGSKVKDYPEVVKKAFDKGNLVLSHSNNHVELTKLDSKSILAELGEAGKAIKSVIGKEPAILRPPYGDIDAKLAAISREEGYSAVLWSIDTLDWSQKEAENIVKNVVDYVRNGDIILMHSDADKIETEKALPLIIEALQEKNFEIVDLETLLHVKAYQ